MAKPGTPATPVLLLDVASALFARRGVDAVSIRSITREAGVGPAAIHYHFKTKDALVSAIIQRHGRVVVTQIDARARALLSTARPLTAWDVVDCAATPYFRLLDTDPARGPEWLGIVGQLARVRDDRALSGSEETTDLLYELVQRAFPEASRSRCELATQVAMSTLLTLLGQQEAGHCLSRSFSPTARRLIVDFVAGGLTVAATRT